MTDVSPEALRNRPSATAGATVFACAWNCPAGELPDEIIEDILAALGDEYDEMTTLSELMARKFEGFDPQQAEERQKRRVISYFQRRGFSLAAIVRVFRDRGE